MFISSPFKEIFFYPEKSIDYWDIEIGAIIQVRNDVEVPSLFRNKKLTVRNISHVCYNDKKYIEYTLLSDTRELSYLSVCKENDGIYYGFSIPIGISDCVIHNENDKGFDIKKLPIGNEVSIQLSKNALSNKKYQAKSIQELIAPKYIKQKHQGVDYGDGLGTVYFLSDADGIREFSLEHWVADDEDPAESECYLTYYLEADYIKSIRQPSGFSYTNLWWLIWLFLIFSCISFITGYFFYGKDEVVLLSENQYIENQVSPTETQKVFWGTIDLPEPIVVDTVNQSYSFYVSTALPPFFKWGDVEIEVKDANHNYLYSFSDEFWHEKGYDDGEYWEEWKNGYRVNTTFITPGAYYLTIKVSANYVVPHIAIIISKLNGSGIPHIKLSLWLLLLAGFLYFYLQRRFCS